MSQAVNALVQWDFGQGQIDPMHGFLRIDSPTRFADGTSAILNLNLAVMGRPKEERREE